MSPALNEVLILSLKTFLLSMGMLIPLFGYFALWSRIYRAERKMQELRRLSDPIQSRRRTDTRAQASRAIWDKTVSIDKGKASYIEQKVMTYIEEFNGTLCKSNSAHENPANFYLLNEAFEKLGKHPELYEDPQLYDFATLLVMAHSVRAIRLTKILLISTY